MNNESTVIICDICHSGSTDERRFTYCKDCGAVCPSCEHAQDCTENLTNAIIEFMLTQPTEEQIEAFYINQVMPKDKRSISEILLDNVLGTARLSGMITIERSEETFDHELVECTSEDGYLLIKPIASTNAYLMDILISSYEGQMSFDIQELTVRITNDGMVYMTDASTGDEFTLQIAS